MNNRIVESLLESAAVTVSRKTTSVDVTVGGGDCIAMQVVATAASSPTGATIGLEASLDNTNFVAIGSLVSVTGNGTFAVSLDRPPFRYYRLSYVIVSGSYTSALRVLIKGDGA